MYLPRRPRRFLTSSRTSSVRHPGQEFHRNQGLTAPMTIHCPGIWAEIEAQNPGDPGGQLYGFMDKAAIFIAGDERGCDLANAAIELTEQGHPGLRVIEEFKMRQRERLTNLCKAAGASQPDLLADTLFLLIEGARVSRRSVGTNGPSANLVRTSRGVIASFGVRPPDASQSFPERQPSAQ